MLGRQPGLALGHPWLVRGRLTLSYSDVPLWVSGLAQDVTILVGGGENSYCAVRMDKQADCWGRNAYGSLGNGSGVFDSAMPVPVKGLRDLLVALATRSSTATVPLLRISEIPHCRSPKFPRQPEAVEGLGRSLDHAQVATSSSVPGPVA